MMVKDCLIALLMSGATCRSSRTLPTEIAMESTIFATLLGVILFM